MAVAYTETAAHLRERLVEGLPGRIESIVLYGSVARNEANRESDIDILIVTRSADRKLYDKISKIRTRIDLDSNTLTTLTQMSRDEAERYVNLGSPFMETVLEEGIILYDTGFFKKIRGSLTPKS